MTVTLSPSVNRWQRERDGLLDRLSYLEETRTRTGEFLIELSAIPDITPFDITEALALLWESQPDSELRRFGHLLQSEVEQEEEPA
jgi:hypothetical protein